MRGAILLGLRVWVQEALRAREHETLATRLGDENARLLLDPSMVHTTQVPASAFRALCQRMIDLWGLEGPLGFHAAAGHVAMSDLATYMKVLMKLGTPGFVAHRFPRVWRHYFTHGELAVRNETGSRLRVHVADAAAYGDGALEGAVGWMLAAITYAGARGARVVREPGTDANRVDYTVSWIA